MSPSAAVVQVKIVLGAPAKAGYDQFLANARFDEFLGLSCHTQSPTGTALNRPRHLRPNVKPLFYRQAQIDARQWENDRRC
jgi:hypothetical protein